MIARVCHPVSKLATTRGSSNTTLDGDLGVADAIAVEVIAAMDWLAAGHLSEEANPARLRLFDLFSTWVTRHSAAGGLRPLPRREEGVEQIEHRIITGGRPVSVRVVPGHTADPRVFEDLAADFKCRYRLGGMVRSGTVRWSPTSGSNSSKN
ncbi:hypothetical protein [Arthrobacter sp. ISL-95]|uniref:hypothetical protein n=1 Tax=Arthrobacter sp. ISL-95 TaxID=2819116 RepID=UPI001BE866C3|nr:hypothetical protein [Arthrobacter sp. ISL-95]MBT2587159.1 hypothetical protein [Arthrobacter sp. ISL-95]